MRRPLPAAALAAAALLVFFAQDLEAQTHHRGIGNTPCDEFARLHEDAPGETDAVYYSWAMGVMSGLNVSLAEQRANLMPHNFDADAQKRYIRRYCDKRPSDLYVDAVFELYAALRRKQSLPPWRFMRHRHR